MMTFLKWLIRELPLFVLSKTILLDFFVTRVGKSQIRFRGHQQLMQNHKQKLMTTSMNFVDETSTTQIKQKEIQAIYSASNEPRPRKRRLRKQLRDNNLLKHYFEWRKKRSGAQSTTRVISTHEMSSSNVFQYQIKQMGQFDCLMRSHVSINPSPQSDNTTDMSSSQQVDDCTCEPVKYGINVGDQLGLKLDLDDFMISASTVM